MSKEVKFVRDYSNENEEGEEIKLPLYEAAQVDTKYVKIYQSVLARLAGLNSMAGNFVIYLASIMDSNNYVRIDKEVKDRFVEFMSKEGVKYSAESLYKTISQLIDLKILIRIDKSKYFLNPRYFFKDSERKRESAIKFILEVDSTTHSIISFKQVQNVDKKFKLVKIEDELPNIPILEDNTDEL